MGVNVRVCLASVIMISSLLEDSSDGFFSFYYSKWIGKSMISFFSGIEKLKKSVGVRVWVWMCTLKNTCFIEPLKNVL